MRNPLVEDFRAVAEDGSKCHVNVWQSGSDTSFRTAVGRPLKRIDDQTFEVVETGQRFKRV